MRLERGRALVAAGADIIDVGGESARGDRPAVPAAEEIARVEELVAALVKDGVLTSIDTYKYDVAEAAIAAGAAIVNDVSGLRDERLAALCASTGAALVIMHTAVEPKGTLLDPATYEDVAAEVVRVPARADRRRAGGGRRVRAADPRPRAGLRQDARADRRGAAADGPAARARAADPAGRLAQGLRRRDHGPRAGGARPGDAGGARRAGSTRAPRSCACTTSRAPRTTSRCASVLRGERVLGALEGLTPERYPDGVPPHLTLG